MLLGTALSVTPATDMVYGPAKLQTRVKLYLQGLGAQGREAPRGESGNVMTCDLCRQHALAVTRGSWVGVGGDVGRCPTAAI